MYGNHDDEGGHHDGKGDKGDDGDGAAAGRELALHDPVLGLEVALVAEEEGEDADAEERGAQGLAHLAQRLRVLCGVDARVAVEGGVEPEELRYRDADRGEAERCSEPGEECSL